MGWPFTGLVLPKDNRPDDQLLYQAIDLNMVGLGSIGQKQYLVPKVMGFRVDLSTSALSGQVGSYPAALK